LRVTFTESFSITSDIDILNGILYAIHFRYNFYLALLNTNNFVFFKYLLINVNTQTDRTVHVLSTIKTHTESISLYDKQLLWILENVGTYV